MRQNYNVVLILVVVLHLNLKFSNDVLRLYNALQFGRVLNCVTHQIHRLKDCLLPLLFSFLYVTKKLKYVRKIIVFVQNCTKHSVCFDFD